MTIEKLFVHEKNATTGEEIVREYTDEEYAEHARFVAEANEIEAERLLAAEALASIKASAKAKLIAGEPLTAEEADTLVI